MSDLSEPTANVCSQKQSIFDMCLTKVFPNITIAKCDLWVTAITLFFGIAYNIVGAISLPLGWRIPIFFIHLAAYFLFFAKRQFLTRTEKSEKAALQNLLNDANLIIVNKEKALTQSTRDQSYHRCLAEQYHILAKVIGAKWSREKTKRFYTFVLESIKQQILVTIERQDMNLALSLYAYFPEQDRIQRVATGSTVRSVPEAFETDTRPFKEVENYYYAKCIADKSKSIFILDGNEKIVSEFFFQQQDAAVKASFSQYIAASFAIDYGVRYLVEVITYDKPIITYDLEQLVRQTILPFGLFFKMIGSNLKNCV